MRATTIRWSDTVHRILSEQAEREGTNFATYIRVAAVARWGFENGLDAAMLSGDPEAFRAAVRESYAELGEAIERLNPPGNG